MINMAENFSWTLKPQSEWRPACRTISLIDRMNTVLQTIPGIEPLQHHNCLETSATIDRVKSSSRHLAERGC